MSRILISWLSRLAARRISAALVGLFALVVTAAGGWHSGQSSPAPPSPDEIVGRATVTDGDTIRIGTQRIRLGGIDAPEMGQSCEADGHSYRCGQKAALALDDLIGSRTVHCTPAGRDRYERVLAKCRAGETDLNAWMVEQGLAVAYRRYSADYVAQEERARAARRGLWAGTFEAPGDFRANHARAAERK